MLKLYPELLGDVRNDDQYYPIRALVQPNDPEVRELAFVLEQDHDFVSAAHQFVHSFTAYQREIGDIWRIPAESLLERYIDCLCEDTPLVANYGGTNDLVEVADLVPDVQPLGEKFVPPRRIFVLSGHHNKGASTSRRFREVNWIVKKHSDKDIYRINSKMSVFDVTSDHLFAVRNGSTTIEFLTAPQLQNSRVRLLTAKGYAVVFGKRKWLGYDLGWVYGLFAAEGSIGNSYWKIYNTDRELLEKAKAILECKKQREGKLFGLRTAELEIKSYACFEEGALTNFGPRQKKLWVLVLKCQRGYLKNVVAYFRENFYTKLGNKRVPQSVLNSNAETAKGFLDGFAAGDANSTTSKILASGLTILSDKCGPPYLRIQDQQKCFYLKPLKDKPKTWFRHGVRLLSDKTTRPVYDVNVGEPHIFCAGNVMVHNCDDSAILLCSILRNYIPAEKVFVAVGAWYDGKKADGHAWVVMEDWNGQDRILESTADWDAPVRGRYQLAALFNDQYAFSTRAGLVEFGLRPDGRGLGLAQSPRDILS